MNRRQDPEPLTIVAAIASIVSAGTAATNYWRTHHKPLPNIVRRRLVKQLEKLASELRYLRTEVSELEGIFKRAEFPSGQTLRLGNGALMTYSDFHRYEITTDAALARLRRIHKLAMKVQGHAFALPYVDKGQQASATGNALERADKLLRSQDLSVDAAWVELRALIDDLEAMIVKLNSELGRRPGDQSVA